MKSTAALLLAALVLAVLFRGGAPGRGAFTTPADNLLLNPGVEDWATTTPTLPTGWRVGGYSHVTGWRDLAPTTLPAPVHGGTTSAGFLNKGYDGTPNSPCDDFCWWDSDPAPVVAGTQIQARLFLYPAQFPIPANNNDGVRLSRGRGRLPAVPMQGREGLGAVRRGHLAAEGDGVDPPGRFHNHHYIIARTRLPPRSGPSR